MKLGIAASARVSSSAIAEENLQAGYASANWQITGIGDSGALGYTTAMSVQAGSSIDFKIHTAGTAYTLEVVRLGWYGGAGARKVYEVTGRPGVTQAAGVRHDPFGENGIGSVDCSNWTVTDTWAVPSNTCHGVYLGVIKRSGQGSFGHVGPFVVRTTTGDSASILVKLSDMTWRAYNSFGLLSDPAGGKSLYGIGSGSFSNGDRAWDMSYDAPLVTAYGVPQTSYWNGERPIHAWLERNGYNVAYTSCLDVDSTPSLLLGRSVIMSCGHDEYWSQNVRDAWDAAVNAGVHAVVMSGNTLLWRVRMDGRRMYCYKDTHSLNGEGDGEDPVTWTGCWRDTRWALRRPECESIGTMFVKNGLTSVAITVPDTYKTEPLWRNTSVASLGTGTSETLKTHSLGFEWDSYEPFYTASMAYPPGLKLLSLTATNQTGNACHENGAPYATSINPANHYIVAFKRGTSITVNFGVNQWGYGLSDFHTSHSGGGGVLGENVTMQQATVNLFADLGCQPATLQSGLSAATLTAWTFPTATTVTIPTTLSVDEDLSAQLSATAVWSNGITTDVAKYATWGTSNATIATVSSTGRVTGVAPGTATITATHGTASDTCAVTVTAVGAPVDTWLTLDYAYTGTTNSDGAITIGTQFQKTTAHSAPIYVTGVRFWRTGVSQSTAPVAYLGQVGAGTFITSKVSTVGTGSHPGWEEFEFTTPYEITTGDDYVVWVWVPSGGYAAIAGYFAGNVTSRLGWFDSIGLASGRFTQPPSPSPQTVPPTLNFGNAFYLVEPLITETVDEVDPGAATGIDVTPASVSVATSATTQLTAMVSWENIAPTDRTSTTTWVSGTPANATVASTGLVTGVGAGTSTVTGTFSGFSDTCAVTVTAATGTKWINHVAIAAPRNTLTTHTVSPASGTVITGTAFTPTAGRFLLVVVNASVTSTTPSGWTLRKAHVSNTGLYCWSKTAEGSDTLTTTHNAANYPCGFHFFEFAAGADWVNSVSGDIAVAGANPNLTGLTGTNLVMSAKAAGVTNTAVRTGTWNAPNVEILDYNEPDPGTTDGYWLGIAYQENYTGSSYQPTCTVTNHAASCEAITWALVLP